MNDLKIEQTTNTPLVELKGNGNMCIKGISIPDNGLLFFQPVFNWIEEYGQQPSQKTTLEIALDGYNTVSSKCLLDVLRGFEKVKNSGFEVNVNWYYHEDDPDMLEAGQEFDGFINVKFSFIEVDKN
jgi:hypothetical protein